MRRSGPARRRAGVSLVELLVALAVFVLVIAIAGGGVVQTLRLQRLNEAITTAQAKLRRVTEVLSQDVRSMALGGVTDAPYGYDDAAEPSLSFTIQDGSFYPVLAPTDEAGFADAGGFRIEASASGPDELGLDEVLLINVAGEGVVHRPDSVARVGGGREWSIGLASGCENGVAYSDDTLAHDVRTVGYTLRGDELLRREAGGVEETVAFDIQRFAVAFVYRSEGGSAAPVTADAPRRDPATGALARAVDISGTRYLLDAIRVEVATAEAGGPFGEVERAYATQIPLPAFGPSSALTLEVCP